MNALSSPTVSLVSQLVVRLAVWTQDSSHRAPSVSPGRAQFFVDASHELVLTLAPIRLARIRVGGIMADDQRLVCFQPGFLNTTITHPVACLTIFLVRVFLLPGQCSGKT